MLKIEHRLINLSSDLTPAEKNELLHKEAYSLLDTVLKSVGVFDYTIKKTELGKPYLENSDVHFSIAHTDGLVCCVVADKECGIDCEKITPRDRIKELAERFFVDNEIALLKKNDYSNTEFLRIWTCKEALGKRLGTGLSKSLKIDSTKESFSTFIEKGYIITINI